MPLLSEQQKKIEGALAPFPLYCCVHVKKDIPAKEYCGKLMLREIYRGYYTTLQKYEFYSHVVKTVFY